jgi:hypothetical protein
MPKQEYTDGVMNLKELKSILRAHPAAYPRFTLPDGDQIPAHYHITEVGHVTKRFIDCGGTLHDKTDTCRLQTYVAHDVDHRLDAATFARILDLGTQILPHEEMPVEVEYDCCVVAQYPISGARLEGDGIELQLGERHTDCLAKEKCGLDGEGCGTGAKSETAGATGCC